MHPTLKPETPDDLEFLQRLYVWTHWGDLDLLRWSNERKAAYLLQRFGQQMAHFTENHADGDYWVIWQESTPVGRYYVDARPSEIRLLAIDVLPDHRGKGMGSHLVADLATQAKASNRKIITRVEANGAALGWFERRGFRQFTRHGQFCGLELSPY